MLDIDFSQAPAQNMAAFVAAIRLSNGAGGSATAADRVARFFKSHVSTYPLTVADVAAGNFLPWGSSLAALRTYAQNNGPALSQQDITDALGAAL